MPSAKQRAHASGIALVGLALVGPALGCGPSVGMPAVDTTSTSDPDSSSSSSGGSSTAWSSQESSGSSGASSEVTTEVQAGCPDGSVAIDCGLQPCGGTLPVDDDGCPREPCGDGLACTDDDTCFFPSEWGIPLEEGMVAGYCIPGSDAAVPCAFRPVEVACLGPGPSGARFECAWAETHLQGGLGVDCEQFMRSTTMGCTAIDPLADASPCASPLPCSPGGGPEAGWYDTGSGDVVNLYRLDCEIIPAGPPSDWRQCIFDESGAVIDGPAECACLCA